MALSNETIKNILIKGGIIKEGEWKDLETESKQKDIPITRILISQDRLNQRYLNELTSKFLNVPLFDIRLKPLEQSIVELIPETIARQRQILVFEKDPPKNIFKVAMVDPTNIEALNFLKEYLKGEIEPYLTTQEDLNFGYQIYKQKASENFETIISERIKELRISLQRGGENILENIPLVQLSDTIIDYAVLLGSSDIYFQPQEDFLKVRFRIDGKLKDITLLDKSINEGIVARIKALSNLRIDEHLKPQDGRFRFRSGNAELDIRTAIMPTFSGEKVSLRLLSGAQFFITFDEFGMEQNTIQKLQEAIKNPYGMILNTGPTGSGKTTTLYGIINALNKPDVHITTIEDPIEYRVSNISQTQVNLDAGITFASGLRALLRHSPDIILIGEIRDSETADVAVNAALTGHLLISTLHTNDAPSALIRLIDLGIPPFLISATLNVVLAQRLVRKICSNCVESYTPPSSVIEKINQELYKWGKKIKMSKTMFRGKGCNICGNTGYKGRIGLFEILLIDDAMRNLINMPKITLDQIKQGVNKQGMVSMFEDGLSKVDRGITTIEEVFRVINE